MARSINVFISFALTAALVGGGAVQADTITETLDATTLLSVGGTLQFNSGYGSGFSGVTNELSPLKISFGSLNLPSNSTLTSVLLELSGATNGSSPVSTSYSDSVSSYPTYAYEDVIVGYYEYECGFLCWGYAPEYQWEYVQTGTAQGYGGSASFSSQNSSAFSSIKVGGTTVSVPNSGGNFDLLALGFGSDLLGGGSIDVYGTSSLSLGYAIQNYGYYSSTTYTAAGSFTPDLQAELVATYNTADPAPEPSSWLLMGCGLIGFFAYRLIEGRRNAAQSRVK